MTHSDNQVRCRIHLAARPEIVHSFLATDAGRASFWAQSAVETEGVIDFRFSNGMNLRSRVLASEAPIRFVVEYFGGSQASFELDRTGAGGTDLILTETGVPGEWFAEHRAGWVTVLLCLKAAVDFGVDLRNPDPERSWEQEYVDV